MWERKQSACLQQLNTAMKFLGSMLSKEKQQLFSGIADNCLCFLQSPKNLLKIKSKMLNNCNALQQACSSNFEHKKG